MGVIFMEIIDYDKIELVFEEFSIILPRNTIEKFQIDKVEQFIEAKYNSRDEYNVCIVINEMIGEKVWEKEIPNQFKRNIK
jgi:hypothetical protein